MEVTILKVVVRIKGIIYTKFSLNVVNRVYDFKQNDMITKPILPQAN